MIKKDSGFPYYLQIYEELKKRISDKTYLPGAPIPSENELVEEFKVTRVTIRNAIKKLKDEDYIHTEKGKGSYVNYPKIEQSLFKFYSFGRDYTSLNIQSELLKLEDTDDDSILNIFQLEPPGTVKKIIRIRKIDNTPVIVETSYIPSAMVPDIEKFDLENLSIYDLLEQNFGLHILKAKEYLDTIIADENYSKLLEIDKGSPVFVTERITYGTEQKPIEFRRSIIRSDKFRFSVDLKY